MLIDFQSKFNNFNDVRFSDQVSGCDFEFSSVLRRWWKGWGKNGEDMEGEWSVQQITLYWTSANIYHHRRSLFFDILKFSIGFPTNCWQILNWRQFQSVSTLFFTFTICHLWFFCWQKTLCYKLKRVFLLFVFLTRLDTVRLNFVMTCFLFI